LPTEEETLEEKEKADATKCVSKDGCGQILVLHMCGVYKASVSRLAAINAQLIRLGDFAFDMEAARKRTDRKSVV
jgi:hypothetical protein